MNKRGAIAISQILILVIGIIAISYAIGSEVGFVSGDGEIVESDIIADSEGEEYIVEDVDVSKETSGITLDPNNPPYTSSGTNPSSVAPAAALKPAKEIKGKATTTPTTGGSSMASKFLGIKDAAGGEAGGFISWETGGFADAIISGAQWGIVAFYAVKMLGGVLGLDKYEIDAASKAAGWSFAAGKTLYTLIGKKGAWSSAFGETRLWMTPGQFSFGVGIAVALYVYYTSYEKESQKTVLYSCYPWDAPVGGDYCEDCNNQGEGITCSEYQCKSLGQSCELINPGTTEELCVWVNRNDIKPPVIEPWEDALGDDFKYEPDNAISPPDRGVIVWNENSTDGCVEAFTPMTFGVILDEPAKCKLDYLRKSTFDDMDYYFGGSSLLRYNHTQTMSVPGTANLEAENLTIANDGEYELYARCQDSNGNYNIANFVFKFCVEEGPDTTPPLIVTTSLLNNMPIAYNQTSVSLEVYVNEPAECRWSKRDQSYDEMEEDMSCSSSITEMNVQMLYECSTTLTGLKNRQDNDFYFRCKDQPLNSKDRNTNVESYEFTLIGTQPLVIDSLEPNGTIKDSTDVVNITLEVETSAGYDEGEADCYYSDTGDTDSYILFFETDSYIHSQDLYLIEGDYEYFIKCIDLGGNQDNGTITFTVESDSTTPIVVRAFHEEIYLKLITNEPAECVYDTTDCSYLFDDGTQMTTVDDSDHYTDWKTDTNFYVKCQDEYGNQPLPNACNIIVTPFEVYKSEKE